MIVLFNSAIKNILPNYITHETFFCDDRYLPSINNRIKELINEKKIYFPKLSS